MTPTRRTRTLVLAIAASALAACSAPGATVPGIGYVGTGPLPFDVLAVSTTDPVTGNASYRVNLKWSAAPGGKSYEVWRKFGDQAQLTVLTTTEKDAYVDTSLSAKQAATYKIRAIGGDAKELKVSEEKAVTVLAQEVAKPTGLEPADNATLPVGDLPTLKWQAVPNATFYYVRVARVSDEQSVFSALTKATSIKFGDQSPLAFNAFGDLFGTGNPGGIQKGVVHRWTVQALRTDGATDPAAVRAVDANTSAESKFSQL
jgi:hypothetical protein